MKTQHILVIILLAAMVLSLVACGATSTDTHTSTGITTATEPSATAELTTTAEPTQPSTETTTTEVPTDTSATTTEEVRIKEIPLESFASMTEEELSESCKNMLQLSKEALSLSDMQSLALNFFYAWQVADESISQIERLATETFDNVLIQIIAQDITMDELEVWGAIPVVEIQSKYFSSSRFGTGPNQDIFDPFVLVQEEEFALLIANTIVLNAKLKSYFNLAEHFIESKFPKVKELGIAWMKELSMMSSSPEFSSSYTFFFCHSLERCRESLTDPTILYEIRENVLKNQFLDFVEKYTTLCNSQDVSVASQAFERLMLLAENPSPETAAMIRKVCTRLWDGDAAALLLHTLGDS